MGYDRAITLFSPDGRLFQIEYALEAVKRGPTVIGVRTEEGVIITVENKPHAKLLETESVRKVSVLDDHIGCTFAGLTGDARVLISNARTQAQIHRLTYGIPPSVEFITRKVCDSLQVYTQHAGVRPFGCSLLLAGVDSGGPQVCIAEPSGSYWGYLACSIGSRAREVTEYLEKHYLPSISLQEGISISLSAMQSTVDNGQFDSSMVEIAVIPVLERNLRWIPVEEIGKHLEDQ